MKLKRTSLIAAGTAVTLSAVIAAPVLTTAQEPATTTITVQEKVQTVVQDDIAPKSKAHKVSVGDRLVTVQSLFDAGKKRIGTLYTDCTSVGPLNRFPKLTILCTATFELPAGQIIVAGVGRLDETSGEGLPIVGGSGAYAGARGTAATVKSAKGYDSADLITITR